MRHDYPQPQLLATDNARQPTDLSHEDWSGQMYGTLAGEASEGPPAVSWHRRRPPRLPTRPA